jgi:hypothetical protein
MLRGRTLVPGHLLASSIPSSNAFLFHFHRMGKKGKGTLHVLNAGLPSIRRLLTVTTLRS